MTVHSIFKARFSRIVPCAFSPSRSPGRDAKAFPLGADRIPAVESNDYKTPRARFRFKMPCPVSYRVEGAVAQASVLDISPDGVRVEEATHALRTGARTRMTLRLAEDGDPIELEVEVIRQADRGFAGRFVNLDRELAQQLWDGIAAAAKARLTESAEEPAG